ncbi:MAG: ABC transporter permease [Lachnospiraceae bacterium]
MLRRVIFCSLCFVIAGAMSIASNVLERKLPHETVAYTWDQEGDTAHISVYLSETEKYALKESLDQTSYQLKSWYYTLEDDLKEASIINDSDNEEARLIVNAYSASGSISATTDHGSVTCKAYGVGGDFFLFHPMELVTGSYFSESDLMQDKVILDEDAAWSLFGSNDIIGQFIQILGVPHMVVGVIESSDGYFNDKAGNDVMTIYVSHETLYNYGTYYGLETVEFFLPNPVTDFGYGLVSDLLSGMDVEVVEHQDRFSFFGLIDVLKEIPIRSMGLSGITLPYWENMARAYEDMLAVMLCIQMVFIVIPSVIIIIWLWGKWLGRSWRTKDVYEKLKDKAYAKSVAKSSRKRHIEENFELDDEK